MAIEMGTAEAARLEESGEHWTLIFVREFNQPPAVVWTALTDPAELDQWAPFRAATDLGRPGDTTLTMVDGDERLDLPAYVKRPTHPACSSIRGAGICCAGNWNPRVGARG